MQLFGRKLDARNLVLFTAPIDHRGELRQGVEARLNLAAD
jgi:hypothetical protein